MLQTRILLAYASRHGSTREVAEAVAATLRARGLAVDVMPAAGVAHLRQYAGVILGGALYSGRLHKDARRFLVRRTAGFNGWDGGPSGRSCRHAAHGERHLTCPRHPRNDCGHSP